MIRYLWAAVVVLGLALLWSLRSGAAADQRARSAEHLVDSLTVVRQKYEAVARQDSLKLEESRTAAVVRESQLEAERARILGKAAQAHEQADTASRSLATLLDSLGASHEALDRLNAAHAAEIQAKDAQIALADSTAAVVKTLLQATETALASERAVGSALRNENGAVRADVQALKSGRRRDRLGGVALLGAVVAVVVLTR